MIGIENFTMPENCKSCAFARTIGINLECKILNAIVPDDREHEYYRDRHCPLVEIEDEELAGGEVYCHHCGATFTPIDKHYDHDEDGYAYCTVQCPYCGDITVL